LQASHLVHGALQPGKWIGSRVAVRVQQSFKLRSIGWEVTLLGLGIQETPTNGIDVRIEVWLGELLSQHVAMWWR
jgi:hypothetical protein